MAKLVSWRDQLPQTYNGARKWGTGINPVHMDADDGTGRVLSPNDAPVGLPSDSALLSMGWTQEDLAATGNFGFMDEHPDWGEPAPRGRSDLPSWGHRNGPPAGTGIRALKRGMNVKETEAQQVPSETVGEGWVNKLTGQLLDSRTSDPSQYEIQTSMAQRDLSRDNSAASTRETDAPRSNIASHMVGMKVKPWSTGERLGDMEPWTQDQAYRPFLYRSAGVPDASGMESNAMYVSQPMQRSVPADVDQGQFEAGTDYGYSAGDYFV